VLRLFAIARPSGYRNFWDVPNLLLQKFPADQFTATVKVAFNPLADQDQTGLIVMGADYAYVAVRKRGDQLSVAQVVCKRAEQGLAEQEFGVAAVSGANFYLRVAVSPGAECRFSYSTDGAGFTPIGQPFAAKPGRWIGAKVGIFALGTGSAREFGYADFDWFHVE